MIQGTAFNQVDTVYDKTPFGIITKCMYFQASWLTGFIVLQNSTTFYQLKAQLFYVRIYLIWGGGKSFVYWLNVPHLLMRYSYLSTVDGSSNCSILMKPYIKGRY